MALTFKNEDALRMKQVERELVQVLLPYRGNTEAALIVFALTRCARTLLRLYPEATRDELARILSSFLKGETAPAGVETESGLLLM